MTNLMLEFESDNSKAGYRLHRLEVLNWGTFKQGTIAPYGKTSFLTGANGSGKSTLVDGLLTLLVPNGKRNYNLASGSGKRERDEKTYVLGAYSTIKTEDDYKSKPQYLRTKDDYSVLLAYFYNEGYKQNVTLAQVLYVKEGVEKLFVVAAGELSIAEHFNDFKSLPELKKKLASFQKVKIEQFHTFADYSKRFRKIFGVESEKAFDLFNQTVSIKEIGKLNDFVRGHMLEKTNVENTIQELIEYYENLTSSHEAMQKAKKQLEVLKPLIADSESYENVKETLDELNKVWPIVPAYFAQRKIGLLQKAIADKQQEHTQIRHNLSEICRVIEGLRQQEKDLTVAIETDETGRRIKELEQQIKSLDRQIANHRQAAQKYDRIAEGIGFPTYSDLDTFNSSIIQARETQKSVDVELEELKTQRDDKKNNEKQVKDSCTELNQELLSLRQRKNQIPAENLGIREKILTALGIAESEIPFVGELLKVKDGERQEWEGAIEKLLHNFGLQLLVPEKYYHQFTRYVDRTHLRGRVIYQKVDNKNLDLVSKNLDNNSLFNKLEIKSDTECTVWLTNELLKYYGDCICCQDLELFERQNYAITKNGLIKKGNRHEKDDRHSINDNKKRYILGWDNSDKIKAYEADSIQLKAELSRVEKALQGIDKKLEECRVKKNRLEQLLEFNDFCAIDWKPDESQKQTLVEQKQELEGNCDRLEQLKTKLAVVCADIQTNDAAKSVAERNIGIIDRDIEHYQKQSAECEQRSSLSTSQEIQTYTPDIEESFSNQILTLDNIDSLKYQVKESYQTQISDANKKLNSLRNSIEKKMSSYKGDYPAETANVDASVEFIPEFKGMLEKIERDDLPTQEQRFKKLLDEKINSAIYNFKDTLEEWESDIKDNIYDLNQSLKMIEYTPLTYIQVQWDANGENQIKEFKNLLKKGLCYADVGLERTSEADEASFKKIKELIDRLQSDERWTARVTDVRNWLNFSVSVKNKADDTEREYHSDSSGKSGGQKAKLAYTILASAIAYQFGLVQDETKSQSFRLVVIDEAFSKSDETNARYAMDLFKQLNLQLLVVTPKDKIQVLEHYAGAGYYVENSIEENDSKVYNMSVDKQPLGQIASN
ncbi:SbcC/MukB-like Walker B domain-containing protein [Microcoleus sp. BR0-C5]|uniref:SbcC/MukB-like Walker B domain-containing protein n=1 Tax=Microcoleus sp. BR0-C5 TaxID=2818713 RepID=UPI002FD14AE2